jgi:hypothetical protein
LTKRSWIEESGVGKDSKRTLTQEIIGDHLNGAAKDFCGAEKILAEEAASKRYTDYYAQLAAKAKLLHRYLP